MGSVFELRLWSSRLSTDLLWRSNLGFSWATHLQPLQNCLGCSIHLVVVLKGEPSPHSEVVCTLEQVFYKASLYFGYIHPSLNSDQSPHSHHWEAPHSMMLPPPGFAVGTVLSRWCAVPIFRRKKVLAVLPKVFHFITPGNLFLTHKALLSRMPHLSIAPALGRFKVQNYWGQCCPWNTQSSRTCFISLRWSTPCYNLIAETAPWLVFCPDNAV